MFHVRSFMASYAHDVNTLHFILHPGIAMPSSSITANWMLQHTLAHTSSALAHWDTALVCRYANDAYKRFFQSGHTTPVGMTYEELCGGALYKETAPYFRAVLDGRAQAFTQWHTGPDGRSRQILTRFHPAVLEGIVVGFTAEVSDCKRLMELEAALQAETAMKEHLALALTKKEQALELAQQLGRTGSWHWEIASDITTWSAGLYHLFGRDPRLLPPSYAEHATLYTKASWNSLQRAVSASIEHGTPYVLELEYYGAGGSTGWLEARGDVERDTDGKIVALYGSTREISETKALFDQIEAQNERLTLALDAAEFGIWRWNNEDGMLAWENGQVRALFGLMEDDDNRAASADFFRSLLHPEDLGDFLDSARVFFDGGTKNFSFSGRFYRRNDGQLRWMKCDGRASTQEHGATVMIGTVSDITQRFMTEKTTLDLIAGLVETDRIRTTFLLQLAHELRNCIAPLSHGLELLHGRAPAAGTASITAAMARQLAHASRLVDDLLDPRQTRDGDVVLQRAPASLNAVLGHAVDMCAAAMRKAQHRLYVDLPQETAIVNGDAVRLTQAFVNLLANACKFTPSPGTISLSLSLEPDGGVVCTVSDDGVGMLPDELDRVFGLYVQGNRRAEHNAGGMGIGLYLTRQIVELHGGAISIESAGLGKGSRVTVALPVLQAQL